MDINVNNEDSNKVNIEMTTEAKVFPSIRAFAASVKHMIDCHASKVPPSEGCPILSWEELVQYLGKCMDYSTNRKMLLKVSGPSKTFQTILRDDRMDLFIKALKEYSPELYVNL